MDAITQVPFFSAAGAAFGVDLVEPVERVIRSGRFVLGPHVSEFEAAFAQYIGVDHAVGLANGTDALILALRALGVQEGQHVVTVANAGCYSSVAIDQIGAVPLYVDVDPLRLTLSPECLEEALSREKPAAVIVTHLYGRMADVEAISNLCRRAGVPLVEDCAQAHGAEFGGRKAGAFGDVGCFSFYPTKNLGAIGDGGALVARDGALAGRVRSLRQYGWRRKYETELPHGFNSRLDELQAAVLLAKLPRLDAANNERRAIAVAYGRAFSGLDLVCPPSPTAADVVHLYVIRTRQREALVAHLANHGVATDVHYPIADHRQPLRADSDSPGLAISEAACQEVLSLPCCPGMTAEQIAQVMAGVRAFFDEVAAC